MSEKASNPMPLTMTSVALSGSVPAPLNWRTASQASPCMKRTKRAMPVTTAPRRARRPAVSMASASRIASRSSCPANQA